MSDLTVANDLDQWRGEYLDAEAAELTIPDDSIFSRSLRGEFPKKLVVSFDAAQSESGSCYAVIHNVSLSCRLADSIDFDKIGRYFWNCSIGQKGFKSLRIEVHSKKRPGARFRISLFRNGRCIGCGSFDFSEGMSAFNELKVRLNQFDIPAMICSPQIKATFITLTLPFKIHIRGLVKFNPLYDLDVERFSSARMNVVIQRKGDPSTARRLSVHVFMSGKVLVTGISHYYQLTKVVKLVLWHVRQFFEHIDAST